MLTFQVEQWPDIWREAKALWDLHFEEVGEGKIRGWDLDPDIGRFDAIHANGALHIVTVRKNAELVGYHASIVERLLHYRQILAGKSDLYWIRSDCRTGRTPLRLFEMVERTLKARGVQMLYDGTKLSHDHGRLFEHLGYQPIERRYSKWIGDVVEPTPERAN